MNIEVFLKKNEKGCNFSKDFETHFINGKKLHPKVKKVKATSFKFKWHDNISEPEVRVTDKGKLIYYQLGNQVSAHGLQEFIIENT